MNHSRRDLTVLLSALALSQGGPEASAQEAQLPSRSFLFRDLPVKSNGENRTRAVFNGQTHAAVPIELHITSLGPGLAPHPPHHHAHEEMIMIQEGTLEVTIKGNKTEIGPGSVAYVASNEEHGWRNVGATRAQYFVLAIGRDKA